MKLGYMGLPRNPPHNKRDLSTVYNEFIDDAVYAEELGLDFAWLSEHHLSPDQWVPSLLPMLSTIAGRTDDIRLGTSIIILPVHDPLRLAEDAAVFDNISHGRLDLGVSVGSRSDEMEFWNLRKDERIGRSWESIDFIDRCFTEEGVFDHDGRYYTYNDVNFTTKPAQDEVPIWFGAFGERNLERTAERGYHLMMNSEYYDEALEAAGRDPSEYYQAPLQYLHLAESRERAWEEAAEGLHHFLSFYREHSDLDIGATAEAPLPEIPPPEKLRDVGGLRMTPGEDRPPFMIGTPADALETLIGIRDGEFGRITHVPLTFRHAGMETEPVRNSMNLFRDEVLPELH